MKAKSRYVCRRPLYKYVLVIALLGAVLGAAAQAEAILTPQSISGSVEVLVQGEQNWKPLMPGMDLNEGDQVQTGPGGAVELWFEDGSVFKIGEDTKLALSELDISPDQKTRVSRVKLLWGAITAKITKLGVTKSVCEIETDTVVAGIKFSQMTVIKSKGGLEPDKVLAQQGLTEIFQKAEGIVNISALFDEEEGLQFILNSVGATVSAAVQPLLRKITLLSNVPLMIQGYTSLRIENLGDTPINANIGGNMTTLQQNAIARIVTPADQLLQIEAIRAAFTAQPQKSPESNVVLVFNLQGKVSFNNKEVKEGGFVSAQIVAGDQSRGGIEEKKEILQQRTLQTETQRPPFEGSDPTTGSDSGGGEEQEATPTPTPIVEPTEIIEEPTPIPTPTPTPIPEPTNTPMPIPTGTPRPDYNPGPPPTQPTPTPTPESASPTLPLS